MCYVKNVTEGREEGGEGRGGPGSVFLLDTGMSGVGTSETISLNI